MSISTTPHPTPPPSTDVRQSLVRHFQRYKMNGRLPRDSVKTNTDTRVISKQDGTSSFPPPPPPLQTNLPFNHILVVLRVLFSKSATSHRNTNSLGPPDSRLKSLLCDLMTETKLMHVTPYRECRRHPSFLNCF